MSKQKPIIAIKVDNPDIFKKSAIDAISFPNKVICTFHLPRKRWLEERQKGVGGSDIASICGINPWHSALATYYDKVEKVSEIEVESIPMEMGVFLEPFIAIKFNKWLKENGENFPTDTPTVQKMPYILQHPTNKIALANLDGWFFHPLKNEEVIVEFKTTSERNYKNWVDENIPDYYYLQTQWYLYVTGCKTCYIACLVGNTKFVVTVVERNEEVIEQIVEKVDYFWKNFVEKKVPPAPDGSESSKETLKLLYKDVEVGKEIVIEDKAFPQYLTEVAKLKGTAKSTKEQLEYLQQLIKEKMGHAEKATCGDWKITWKEQHKKECLVKASTFRVLRISKK